MSENLPIIFAVYPLLLSAVALIWLLRSRCRSWSNWAIRALACGSIIAFVFLAGSWVFTSYYLRYVLPVLFAVIASYSYRRMKRGASGATTQNTGMPVSSALVFLLFVGLDALTIASHYHSGEALNVSFPLASGAYYVLQGGTSVVTNPFHALSGSNLALDIVKLNSLGNRADGIFPRALNAYEIFGEKLYSPCEGSVLRVRDSLPDNPPGKPDAEHPEGNYIVLKCADAEIFMGHLMQGSIEVAQGEVVTVGQPIAQIGNSGNTLEPHLHIEAKKSGAECGLRFDGRLLSVNNVVICRQEMPNLALHRRRQTVPRR